MAKRSKNLPCYASNGWIIEKRPNSFSEQWAWRATACDTAGFRTQYEGFNTLRAARAYCETHTAPQKITGERP